MQFACDILSQVLDLQRRMNQCRERVKAEKRRDAEMRAKFTSQRRLRRFHQAVARNRTAELKHRPADRMNDVNPTDPLTKDLWRTKETRAWFSDVDAAKKNANRGRSTYLRSVAEGLAIRGRMEDTDALLATGEIPHDLIPLNKRI